MSARGYELDEAVRKLAEAVRRLDGKQARVRLVEGSNVNYDGTGSGSAETDMQGAIDDLYAAIAGFVSGVTVQDEGTPLATLATTFDFVGTGVTATGAGATKTITIPGVDGSPNLDGGLATSTYGGVAALDAGGA